MDDIFRSVASSLPATVNREKLTVLLNNHNASVVQVVLAPPAPPGPPVEQLQVEGQTGEPPLSELLERQRSLLAELQQVNALLLAHFITI